MKKYIQTNKKGLILVLIGFISLNLLFINDYRTSYLKEINYQPKEIEAMLELSEEERQSIVLDSYSNQIRFYAKVFKIDEEVLFQKLKENYQELNIQENINIDKILIDYLFNLESTDKQLFQRNITSGLGTDKEYILALIAYFCDIYSNVDFTIAASIAHIESGYAAKTMLKNNNIFGGMSKGKLISYKNIEYGVLKYIKLLSESYFGIGLTTVETIGKKYNPVYVDGVKKANPTWVKNVNSVLAKYQDYNIDLAIAELDV